MATSIVLHRENQEESDEPVWAFQFIVFRPLTGERRAGAAPGLYNENNENKAVDAESSLTWRR